MLLPFSIYLSETYPSIVGQTWHVCSNGSVNVGEKNGRLGCLQMACGWCRWRVLRKKCFLFKFKGNAKACRCLYNIILCISQPYKAECMGTKMQHCWFKLKILETCENFQRLGMDFRAFGAFAWLGCSLLQLHHVAATCRITSVTPLDKVCQYKEGGHF